MTISQAASVNLWREAILDRLAVLCMDAPQDEPPASILRRIIAAEVEIALDPSVSDAVPHRTLLQQALDALDAALSDDQPYIERSKAAITALRKALAAPEPADQITSMDYGMFDEATNPPAPVPAGWVMVPREPTEKMIQAAAGAWGESESGLHNAFAAALRGGIAASPAAPLVPDLKHCACEFDGDTCITQCKLHAAHVDTIHEWAERAKAAEGKLSAAPVPLTEAAQDYDWMPEARVSAAQCWCDPETSHAVMDPALAEAVARRIAAWMQTGAFHARNEAYWRDRCKAAEAHHGITGGSK